MATIFTSDTEYPYYAWAGGSGPAFTNVTAVCAFSGYASCKTLWTEIDNGVQYTAQIQPLWGYTRFTEPPANAIPHSIGLYVKGEYVRSTDTNSANTKGPKVYIGPAAGGIASATLTETAAETHFSASTYGMWGLTDAEWWNLIDDTDRAKIYCSADYPNYPSYFYINSCRMYFRYTLPQSPGTIFMVSSIT
jgi:hypothetical protein